MRVPVRTVGIDLGTTNARVGILKNGNIEVLVNCCGKNCTPSFVAFNHNERLIGEEARNQLTLNPTNTVFNSKRLIGKQFSDTHLQDDMTHFSFKLVKEGAHPSIEIDCLDEAKRFAPEEIHAMIMQKIKEIAGNYLGEEITHAVISVPASFNDSQRQATRDAGVIAGFTDIKLINEPTATAIAYYFCHNQEFHGGVKNLLIFDLGGGKLDVSVVKVGEDIQVLATSGNTSLGGDDFDNRLMGYFAAEFRRKHHRDISRSDRALARLRCASEKAKQTLSFCKEAGVEIDMLCDGTDFCTHITRARFEELCMDLFRSAIESSRRAVQLSGLDPTRIDEILLVGGSVKIPKIQQLLQQAFPDVRMRCSDGLQQPVACGAAIQAAMLGEQIPMLKDLKIHDVTAYALKFENSDGSVSRICDPSTPIPYQKTLSLPWSIEDTNPLMIRVIEGAENHLGDFHLINLPYNDEHCTPPNLEVTFSIDADGILGVSAADRSGESKRKIAVKCEKHGFLPKEIESMRQDAEVYQREDELRKEQIEARNQLEAFVFSLKQEAEYASPDRVDPLERQQVLESCKKILEWLDGNEFTETDEFLFTLRHTQKQLESILLKLRGSIPEDVSVQSEQIWRPSSTFPPHNSLLTGHSHSTALHDQEV